MMTMQFVKLTGRMGGSVHVLADEVVAVRPIYSLSLSAAIVGSTVELATGQAVDVRELPDQVVVAVREAVRQENECSLAAKALGSSRTVPATSQPRPRSARPVAATSPRARPPSPGKAGPGTWWWTWPARRPSSLVSETEPPSEVGHEWSIDSQPDGSVRLELRRVVPASALDMPHPPPAGGLVVPGR